MAIVVIPLLWATLCKPLHADSTPLQSFEEVRLAGGEWADGDSFRVQLNDGRQYTVRLYLVDSLETTASDTISQRRILEQAAHFGVRDPVKIIELGQEAKVTVEKLLEKPFTLHTSFGSALGRTKGGRIYGFLTTNQGQDLGSLLVELGYARAHGKLRTPPDGTKATEASNILSDRELIAMFHRRGIWAHTDPEHLVAMRSTMRIAEDTLEEVGKRLSAPKNPININTASLEELGKLDGIGPVLALAIVRARPYSTIEDLKRVPGLGDATIKKIIPDLVDPPTSTP